MSVVTGRLDENHAYADERTRDVYERVDSALATIKEEGLTDPNVVELSRAQADKYRLFANTWSTVSEEQRLDDRDDDIRLFYAAYGATLDRVAAWVEGGLASKLSETDTSALAVLVLSTNVPEAEEYNRRVFEKSKQQG